MNKIFKKNTPGELKPFYSILFYPITLEGRRGTTDEFATIPFHLDLFSAALVELAKSIPVHSLILSSHLFFCLPLFRFPLLFPLLYFNVKRVNINLRKTSLDFFVSLISIVVLDVNSCSSCIKLINISRIYPPL